MLRCAFVCFVVIVAVSNAAPSYSVIGKKLGLCSRKTPEFDTCMSNRLRDLIPDVIKNGFPDLDLESSDPAYTRELKVQYNNGNWTGEIATKNTKTIGISQVQILNVRSSLDNPEEFRVEIDFTMPHIFIEGDYRMQSNLLNINLNTKGYFNITMDNVTGTWDIRGVHINKKGEDYVRIIAVNMLPTVGDMKIYASNLIPNNEELSQAAVELFNRNWRIAYEVLLPTTNEAWSKYMANLLNLIFLRVPYRDLLPEN